MHCHHIKCIISFVHWYFWTYKFLVKLAHTYSIHVSLFRGLEEFTASKKATGPYLLILQGRFEGKRKGLPKIIEIRDVILSWFFFPVPKNWSFRNRLVSCQCDLLGFCPIFSDWNWLWYCYARPIYVSQVRNMKIFLSISNKQLLSSRIFVNLKTKYLLLMFRFQGNFITPIANQRFVNVSLNFIDAIK